MAFNKTPNILYRWHCGAYTWLTCQFPPLSQRPKEGPLSVSKYLKNTAIAGQLGVNFVEQIVLSMGHKWVASDASLDTGIDGEIEIRDPETEEAKNIVLRVQIKTRTSLEQDSNERFCFTCKQEDIDYWMQGNAPVLLIVVKIPEDRAYWISIKDYFSDMERRRSRKVYFDKAADAFDTAASSQLYKLASREVDGLYFAPKSEKEELVSNLLHVSRTPSQLFMAETEYRHPKELIDALKKCVEYPPDEWFLKDERIYSVHNLREEPWASVCDIGTAETIETEEWFNSDSHEVRGNFVRLMNQCLRARARQLGLRWSKDERCYHYRATRDLRDRTVRYKSLQNTVQRDVVRRYAKKKIPDETAYYRHCGFEPAFRRYGGEWFLEITPRYVFTSDGRDLHPYREEYQAKIKAIEGSKAVMGLVIMFASLLSDDNGSLYSTPYPYLGFDGLAETVLDVGINDAEWSSTDEIAPASTREETPDGWLFDQ